MKKVLEAQGPVDQWLALEAGGKEPGNGQKMEGHDLRVSEARPLPLKGDNRQTGGTRTPKKRVS